MGGVPFGNEDGFASIVGDEGVLSIVLPLEFSGHGQAMVVQLEMPVLGHLQEVVFQHFAEDVVAKHFQGMGGEVQPAEYLFGGKGLVRTHLHPCHQLFSQFILSHVFAGLLVLFLRHDGKCLNVSCYKENNFFEKLVDETP